MRVFILSLLVALATAYKTGAPEKICDSKDMIPEHNNVKPNDTAAPYTVTASSFDYTPGQEITVTIQPHNGGKFKGFAVAAVEGGQRIGKWQTTPGLSQQLKNCPIITHVDDSEKPSTTLTWTAPNKSGKVAFDVTIVQTGYVFWINAPVSQG